MKDRKHTMINDSKNSSFYRKRSVSCTWNSNRTSWIHYVVDYRYAYDSKMSPPSGPSERVQRDVDNAGVHAQYFDNTTVDLENIAPIMHPGRLGIP